MKLILGAWDRTSVRRRIDFWTEIFSKTASDDLLTLSAAISFYLALSLSPFLLVLIGSLSLLSLDLQEQLIIEVGKLVGENAAQAVSALIGNMRSTSLLSLSFVGLVTFVTIIITSSAVFSQLKATVDRIIIDPRRRQDDQDAKATQVIFDVVKQRLFSIGMVFLFIVVTMISLIGSTVLNFLISQFSSWNAFLGELINSGVSLGVFTLFFWGFFAVVPRRRLRWTVSLRAAFLTAVLFMIGKFLISYYLSSGAMSSSYGAAGSFLALLLWVYYSSLIVFFGAEVANGLQNFQKPSSRPSI